MRAHHSRECGVCAVLEAAECSLPRHYTRGYNAIKLKDMKLGAFTQHNVLTIGANHLGISSGLRPEPKLGPFLRLSLGSTFTIRRLNWTRFLPRPTILFLARSCLATLGAWLRTLPLRAMEPCFLPPRRRSTKWRVDSFWML